MDYEAVKYVEGFVENIIFRNEENGYTVFNILFRGEEITCVGMLSYISAGEFITAQGEFIDHPVYYLQFSIKSYEFKAPQDKESTRRYLASGAVKGIGEKMADKIVQAFGDDTFRIMEEEPERLAEIKGISLNKAMDIAGQLVDRRDLRAAMIFLQNYGISMQLATRIYKQYGDSLYSIIKENPYKLADDIDGIGFKTADEIATRVGIQVDSDYRIRSACFYVLQQAAANGHIYLPAPELEASVKSLLLIEIQDMEKYLMDLAMEKKIVIRQTEDGQQAVYAASYYYMEAGIAAMLRNLDETYEGDEREIQDRIDRIALGQEVVLDEIQQEAVRKAVLNGVLVITGGPGTGKTTIINTIIRYFEGEGLDIRLAAPTGRAAKRMTEACGREAQTIHRLLEIGGGELSGMQFERNENNPLETDVIIVDEMSMVDVSIMNALLKAIEVGTRLILVGDVDQLPSVGPGNVLKDIIQSGCFPVVKLEKIYRQAAESDIVTNAHKINHGEPVELKTSSRDFIFLKRENADSIISAMYTLLTKKLPEYVGADMQDIQILTPSRKSAVGVDRLNQVMQGLLNPPAAGRQERKNGDVTFREGDKVMQIRNNYQKKWEKRSRYGIPSETGEGVFNGDMGIIREINTFAEQLTVQFEEEKFVEYEFKELEELELAYAITIHKAQGSEYPAVLIPLFPAPRMLMNRNLLYTAVTRARQCVCLVGQEECFRQMEASINEQKRYSSLAQRIREVMADQEERGLLEE